MRTAAPYEVNPRQLRALVLLLALLPLMPAVFVVRFLIEEIRAERLEARAHAREVYQKFLSATKSPLANYALRQLQPSSGEGVADPWQVFDASEIADSVLLVGDHGKLAVPPPPPPAAAGSHPAGPPKPREIQAQQLAHSLLEIGLGQLSLANAARMRWRFFSETPEPLFAVVLSPLKTGAPASTLLLVTTRRHLFDEIGTYYDKLLDRRSVLRVIDENGEATPLLARDDGTPPSGEELAEIALPPPLPAWRVQLFSADKTLVDDIMHEQIVSYAWMLGSTLALTGIIAAVAGWTLSRRISFTELSNDALTTVAHEMKTPLSSTRMLLETLLAGRYRGGPAQVEEYLRLMAGENQRLERLVGSFQMLGRLDHSHGPGAALERVRVSAAEIVETACAHLAPRLQASGCTLEVQIDDPPPILFADKEALTAALVNLLDNAAKYSEPGKQITVRAREEDGGGAVLEVADEGIGIAAGEQNRIFERFYQSDRRLSRTHDGCGLGLSIVQSVIRLHGGKISVKSAPGRGSTFSIHLPPPGGRVASAPTGRRSGLWQWLPRRRRSA
jgi:signal transduction histidine kinase